MRNHALLLLAIGLGACAQAKQVADKAADGNDAIVAQYASVYCSPGWCMKRRAACALPIGATRRVLNDAQYRSIMDFIDETDGTCER